MASQGYLNKLSDMVSGLNLDKSSSLDNYDVSILAKQMAIYLS